MSCINICSRGSAAPNWRSRSAVGSPGASSTRFVTLSSIQHAGPLEPTSNGVAVLTAHSLDCPSLLESLEQRTRAMFRNGGVRELTTGTHEIRWNRLSVLLCEARLRFRRCLVGEDTERVHEAPKRCWRTLGTNGDGAAAS